MAIEFQHISKRFADTRALEDDDTVFGFPILFLKIA